MESYPVPFRLDRRRAPHYRLTNASAETLHWLRCELTGPGMLAAPATSRLEPGGAVDLDIRGDDLSIDSRLVVRWLRANGEEYLWSAVF